MTTWQGQPQPGKLPTPPHWRNVSQRRNLSMILIYASFGLLAAISLLTAGPGFGIGQIFVLIWGICMVLVTVPLQRRKRLKATWNEYGSTFSRDRLAAKALMIGIGVLCAFEVGYAVLVFSGFDLGPWTVSHRPRHRGTASASDVRSSALWTAMFALAVSASLPFIWRRFSGSFLNLSPTGFYAQEKPVRQGNWDDVMDVLDFIPWADPSLPPLSQPPMSPIVFVMRDRSLQLLPSASAYAPDAAAVFWMVRNYWRRAEERVELTNGVAVDRLTRADFPYA